MYLSIYLLITDTASYPTRNVRKKSFTKAKDCHSNNTEMCELYRYYRKDTIDMEYKISYVNERIILCLYHCHFIEEYRIRIFIQHNICNFNQTI